MVHGIDCIGFLSMLVFDFFDRKSNNNLRKGKLDCI